MWTQILKQMGNRVGLLVGQMIALTVGVGYISYFYINHIFPDSRTQQFQQTDCFLISKKLTARGKYPQEYRADFLISYNVNGVQYNRWTSGNGLDISFTRQLKDQQTLLSQFNVGGTYPCWYDQENPEVAVLVMRHNWLSVFSIILPVMISLVVFYYFFKKIYYI